VVKLVVVLERGLSLILDLFSISQLTIKVSERSLGSITIRVNKGNKASKKQRLDLDNVAPILLEFFLYLLLKKIFEFFVIRVTDKTIGEYSEALMSPQLDHVIFGLNSLGGGAGDALEDLAHITQVIGVVRFGRGGSEALLDHLVDVDCV
jgi:hypothetical protein